MSTTSPQHGPTVSFWQRRFEGRATPWDRGGPHPQLEAWIRAGELSPDAGRPSRSSNRHDARLTRVLVPGCGSGYEVARLAEWGFDVTGVDYASAATEKTRTLLRALLRSPASAQVSRAEVIEADLLDYDPPLQFDAIYEQTCLCAMHPDVWHEYANRLAQWLVPGGKLFAQFVQIRRDSAGVGLIEGPPYHCDINAMRSLFPSSHWEWPAPPFVVNTHPAGFSEVGIILVRR